MSAFDPSLSAASSGKHVLRLTGRPSAYAVDGRQIFFPEKAFLLLALLALAPGACLSRQHVRRLLWASDTSQKRAGNLRQLLYRTLDAVPAPLAPVILSDTLDLRLNTEAWAVDIQGVGTDPAAPGGELLQGMEMPTPEFDEWLLLERQRILADREKALTELLVAQNNLSPQRREALAGQLLHIDRANELAYRTIIQLQVESGQIDAARQTFLQCQREVRSEMGVGLDRQTAALGATLRQAVVAEEPKRPPATGVPRIVLLPVGTMLADPLMDRVGRFLLEDLVVGLSRYTDFKIVAAHTSDVLAQMGVDPGQQACLPDMLRFDYCVYMTLKKMQADLCVSFRLTRLSDMQVMWSTEFPFAPDEVGETLSELTRNIVTTLTQSVESSELECGFRDTSPTAYRLYLEGKRLIARTDLPSIRHARKCFKASLHRAGRYSPAQAGMSRAFTMEWLVRGMTDGELLQQAQSFAREACHSFPTGGRGFRELGFVALYRQRLDESLELMERAHALNPNDADILVDSADALAHSGELDRALERSLAARQLNPLPPDYYCWNLGSIYFLSERYPEAIAALEPVNALPATARLLAATHAMSGNRQKARRYAAVVMEHFPDFRVEEAVRRVPNRHVGQTRLLAEGLRLAGLP